LVRIGLDANAPRLARRRSGSSAVSLRPKRARVRSFGWPSRRPSCWCSNRLMTGGQCRRRGKPDHEHLRSQRLTVAGHAPRLHPHAGSDLMQHPFLEQPAWSGETAINEPLWIAPCLAGKWVLHESGSLGLAW